MSEKKSNINPSILYSTISIAIVLFLFAFYGLLFLHANNIGNLIKEKINIIVEIKDGIENNEINRLRIKIESIEGVRSGSVAHIPRERAFIIMKEFLAEVENNPEEIPFQDVLSFNLEAEYYDEDRISAIKDDLILDNAVIDIFAENDTIEMVKSNVKKMSYITLIIGGIFVFLSLAIIYNTMKLKLHADRLEIKTMQLVGATRVFIAKPYIVEAIQLGFKSFLIVSTFIIALLASLYLNIDGFNEIINWWYAAIVLTGILIIGIVLTVGVTRYVVQGYLNADTSSLI